MTLPLRGWSVAAESEADLVGRVRSGDARAFEALYLRYHHSLWRVAYRYVRSTAVAEELVHDVFLAVWRGREVWAIREGVEPYLTSAVKHAALRSLRREAAWVHARDAAGNAGESLAVSGAAPDVTERMAGEEVDRVLAQAVATMPPMRQRVATLRWGRGLTYEEIAIALGISVSAAMQHVSRARAELRVVYDRLTGG